MTETPEERIERLRNNPFAMSDGVSEHYRIEREQQQREAEQEPQR